MKTWLKILYLLVGAMILLLSLALTIGAFISPPSEVVFGIVLGFILLVIGGGFLSYGLGIIKSNRFSNVSLSLLITSLVYGALMLIFNRSGNSESVAIVCVIIAMLAALLLVISLVILLKHRYFPKNEVVQHVQQQDLYPNNKKNNTIVTKKGVIFGIGSSFIIAIVCIVLFPVFSAISIIFTGPLLESHLFLSLVITYLSPFLFINTITFFLVGDKGFRIGVLVGYFWVVLLAGFWIFGLLILTLAGR